MLRNFSFPCMTIVEKLKISPHRENFQMCPHDRCGAIWNSPHMACVWCRKRRHRCKIYAVFATIYVWRKIDNLKYICGEKWQIWGLCKIRVTKSNFWWILTHFTGVFFGKWLIFKFNATELNDVFSELQYHRKALCVELEPLKTISILIGHSKKVHKPLKMPNPKYGVQFLRSKNIFLLKKIPSVLYTT